MSFQSPEHSEEGDVSAQQQQAAATAAVTFTTAGPGQEMLVHFNFNKDREGLFRSEEHAALQRYVSSHYSCFCLDLFDYISSGA